MENLTQPAFDGQESQPKSPLNSHRGAYEYVKMVEVTGRGRIPIECVDNDATHRWTTVKNPTGTHVLLELPIDIDLAGTSPEFIQDGRVDPFKVLEVLRKEASWIAPYVLRVATSRTGVHVMFAVSPLPLVDTSVRAQAMAMAVQHDLIKVFRHLGLGADPHALGLRRLVSNATVHYNKILAKRANSKKDALLQGLANAVRKTKKAFHIGHELRLYLDARAEPKLARLFLFLCGMLTLQRTCMDKLLRGKESPPETTLAAIEPGDSIELKTKEIERLFGLSRPFIRKRFDNFSIPWLAAKHDVSEDTWSIRLMPRRRHMEYLTRALALQDEGKASYSSARPPSDGEFRLIHPLEVRKGEYNVFLWSLIRVYRNLGMSREEAERKVRLRAEATERGMASRNCRQIAAKVKGIYNPRGRVNWSIPADLPDWVLDDASIHKMLCSIERRISLGSRRRALCPVSSIPSPLPCLLTPRELASSTGPVDKPPAPDGISGAPPAFERNALKTVEQCFSEVKTASERIEQRLNPPSSARQLVAIRHRQRVGIFDGDQLLVCVTRRHYRASKALEALSRRPEYLGQALSIHTPHRARQEAYHAAIDAVEWVMPGRILCGRRETREESIARWHQRKLEVVGQ